jgi:hypothetical protein
MDKEITALYDKSSNVIMDWSPKGGCTILTKMFFKNLGLLETALAYNSWIHEYRMHVFSKEHPTLISHIRDKNIYKFKVVRNPFKRAVSSYIHTMKYESMHEVVRKTLWRWNANISFRTFVKYLSKIDINNCDPHYSLQKKFFEYEIPDCYDKIIRLESIEKGIEEINKEKGTHFDLSGISSKHHIDFSNNDGKNVARLKWSKIKDRIPDYKYFYTDELVDMVYKVYQDDFQAYGYSIDDFPR